jgi:hypothetical protein
LVGNTVANQVNSAVTQQISTISATDNTSVKVNAQVNPTTQSSTSNLKRTKSPAKSAANDNKSVKSKKTTSATGAEEKTNRKKRAAADVVKELIHSHELHMSQDSASNTLKKSKV